MQKARIFEETIDMMHFTYKDIEWALVDAVDEKGAALSRAGARFSIQVQKSKIAKPLRSSLLTTVRNFKRLLK